MRFNTSYALFYKLAARNVKNSARDYFIYFFTLMLSVSLFYSFNSISAQFESLGLKDPLSYLAFSSGVLTAFSALVCLIMGALVVYANRFLLRRRKREMGIYAVLGIERRDLNKLLMRETFYIGLCSLGAGLLLGIFGAQILSLGTARLTGISLDSYRFMISVKAILLSILFFGLLFFFVHLFNIRELKKMSLLDMLNADRKNETVAEGPMGLALLFSLFSIGLILGGYGLIIRLADKDAFKALAFGGLLLMAGTWFFFTAVLRMMVRLMKKRRRFYYRGLNMLTASQLSTRLKTEGNSLALISILLFLSLSLTVLGPGIGKFVINGIEQAAPFDGSIFYSPYAETEGILEDPMENLKQKGFSLHSFSEEYEEFWIYESPFITGSFLTGQTSSGVWEGQTDFDGEDADLPLTIIGIDDYNRILKMQNLVPVQLEEGTFAISYTFPPIEETLKRFSRNPKSLNIADTTLFLAENGLWNHAWENKNMLMDRGILILPQYLAETLTPQRWILNYNFLEEKETDDDGLRRMWLEAEPSDYVLWSRQEVLISLTADNLLMTYLGLYLGITFLITSGAVLALLQLSQASDRMKQYQLLRKLGVSQKDRRRSLMKQLRIYFGLPFVLAVLHSAVSVAAIFRHLRGLDLKVLFSVTSFGVLLVFLVYTAYFITTYLGSRRILGI